MFIIRGGLKTETALAIDMRPTTLLRAGLLLAAVSGQLPPSPASSPRPPSLPPNCRCNNECLGAPEYAEDGTCDDGGVGSTYSDCELGTDCEDCGFQVRCLVPPSPPPQPPKLPPDPLPRSPSPCPSPCPPPCPPPPRAPSPPPPSPPPVPPPPSPPSPSPQPPSPPPPSPPPPSPPPPSPPPPPSLPPPPPPPLPPHAPGTAVVSDSVGLTSTLANPDVGHIVLAPGTYALSAELSITRSVTLEAAAAAGSVVLDAQASSSSDRRVLNINPGSSGVVQLIGLNITGGYYGTFENNGGGVYVRSGTVTFSSSSIRETQPTFLAAVSTSSQARSHFRLAPSRETQPTIMAAVSTSGQAQSHFRLAPSRETQPAILAAVSMLECGNLAQWPSSRATYMETLCSRVGVTMSH